MSNPESSPSPLCRPARDADMERITLIYNEAIRTTTATFDTVEKNVDEQRGWFEAHGERSPIVVCEFEGTVVGWASLSLWSDRCAYADTAEISLYVEEIHRGRGYGRMLMESILGAGTRASLHTVIARIAEGNEPSVRLHESFGFRTVGRLEEVGTKFGRRLYVEMLQKHLE